MTLGDFFYISLSNMKAFPHTQLKLQFAFENIFSQFKSSIKHQKKSFPHLNLWLWQSEQFPCVDVTAASIPDT